MVSFSSESVHASVCGRERFFRRLFIFSFFLISLPRYIARIVMTMSKLHSAVSNVTCFDWGICARRQKYFLCVSILSYFLCVVIWSPLVFPRKLALSRLLRPFRHMVDLRHPFARCLRFFPAKYVCGTHTDM